MPRITIEKHIAAPPSTVFEFATDLRRAPERIAGIRRLEVLTDGPIRMGTRFRETRVMFKKEATEEMEIVEFDPPRAYAVGCENHGCRYHTAFSFRPERSGTTVAVRFDGVALTFFSKVMVFLMSPLMRSTCIKAFEKDLEDLSKAIAREAPSAR